MGWAVPSVRRDALNVIRFGGEGDIFALLAVRTDSNTDAGRWFALVRSWTPWLAPRHGKSGFGLDKDGLLCSFLSPQGKHLVFLGLGGINNVTALFRSGDAGRLILSVCHSYPLGFCAVRTEIGPAPK